MKKKLNGIDITFRYTRSQNGKTVLLLHGWGGSLNSFRTLEKQLIDSGFSVITIDFPGFGGSSLPPETFEMIDYFKIVAELLEQENIEKVSIVSHSFGGRVALLLASYLPNKIERLVLCDSAGIKPIFSLKKSIKILKFKLLKNLNKKV